LLAASPGRHYDPTTGTFLSRDPLNAVTRSAYGYVYGNPLNGRDPSGLDTAGKCAGFSALGVAALVTRQYCVVVSVSDSGRVRVGSLSSASANHDGFFGGISGSGSVGFTAGSYWSSAESLSEHNGGSGAIGGSVDIPDTPFSAGVEVGGWCNPETGSQVVSVQKSNGVGRSLFGGEWHITNEETTSDEWGSFDIPEGAVGFANALLGFSGLIVGG
jgi:hypothetical protein